MCNSTKYHRTQLGRGYAVGTALPPPLQLVPRSFYDARTLGCRWLEMAFPEEMRLSMRDNLLGVMLVLQLVLAS
jgi:hypothetical protein